MRDAVRIKRVVIHDVGAERCVEVFPQSNGRPGVCGEIGNAQAPANRGPAGCLSIRANPSGGAASQRDRFSTRAPRGYLSRTPVPCRGDLAGADDHIQIRQRFGRGNAFLACEAVQQVLQHPRFVQPGLRANLLIWGKSRQNLAGLRPRPRMATPFAVLRAFGNKGDGTLALGVPSPLFPNALKGAPEVRAVRQPTDGGTGPGGDVVPDGLPLRLVVASGMAPRSRRPPPRRLEIAHALKRLA